MAGEERVKAARRASEAGLDARRAGQTIRGRGDATPRPSLEERATARQQSDEVERLDLGQVTGTVRTNVAVRRSTR